MALGKKELTAIVVVGIAAAAAAVHFGIFAQKQQEYASTSQEYSAAVEQLNNAEFIRDEQAFADYQAKTIEYEAVATSASAQLNLKTLSFGDGKPAPGAVDQWASQTIVLLSELNQRRGNLSFLGPNGWNLPASLANANPAAQRDAISRLVTAYRALKQSQQPAAEAAARQNYNTALDNLGISAREVSNFAFPNWRQPQFFFNSESWIINQVKSNQSYSSLVGMLPQGGYDLKNLYNYNGLQRFGSAVPELKKIWMYALVKQVLETDDLRQFGEALEIQIPLDNPEPLNSINKQLRALIEIIDVAQRNGVQDIQQVSLMRPINVAKAVIREPGATPPPEATPAPTPDYGGGMGMDMMMMEMGGMPEGGPLGNAHVATPVPDAEAVGVGAGIELYMVGPNAGIVRFYYDISHKTGTYGLDDVYVHQASGGSLRTSATIEVITDVKQQGAAPAPVEEGV